MKNVFENFWFWILIGFAVLQLTTDLGRALLKQADQEPKIQALQQENEQLRAQQNVMVWQMDKSCYDQIKNTFDHTLFLRISPEK